MKRTELFSRPAALCATIAGGLLSLSAQAANVRIPDPILAPIPLGDITVKLEPVADGFVEPVLGVAAPGDERHLFVLDQGGKIWAIDTGHERQDDGAPAAAATKTLFADLTPFIVKVGLFPPLNYDERGLLGLAFHPDFRKNGLLYTFTTEPVAGVADFTTLAPGARADSQTVIAEWHVTRNESADDERAMPTLDLASRRVLLRIDKPQFNHNGGSVVFGKDKLLYVSLGDGGAADDQGAGHLSGGNGQRLDTVLGKVLRIDPLARTSANGQYGIPSGNPFVGKAGIPEIYAYGFRNPFRMSFDSKTGKLYVGEVGQNDIEEIDVVEAGRNYGWPIKEGRFLFDNNGAGPGFVFADSPGNPPELTDPIAQYDHTDGGAPVRVAIVGGFVYRGEAIKALRGRYVFADYSGPIGRGGAGHLYYLDEANAIKELRIDGRAALGEAAIGFGRDAEGELYLLSNATGTLNGSTGRVYRIGALRREQHD